MHAQPAGRFPMIAAIYDRNPPSRSTLTPTPPAFSARSTTLPWRGDLQPDDVDADSMRDDGRFAPAHGVVAVRPPHRRGRGVSGGTRAAGWDSDASRARLRPARGRAA